MVNYDQKIIADFMTLISSLFRIKVVEIGFANETYSFLEPSSETEIRGVKLVKNDDQISEQTFRVGVFVSDATSISPATLDDGNTTNWDYRVNDVGQVYVEIDFPPKEQSITVPFFLNGDKVPEGWEGFLLTSSVASEEFPHFSPPQPDSTTAFLSTKIEILDNDCKLVMVDEYIQSKHSYTVEKLYA